MGSGAMIYIPNFIQTRSGINNLIIQTHRQHYQLICLFFFQNKDSTLKKHKESHYLTISMQQFISLSIILSTLFSKMLHRITACTLFPESICSKWTAGIRFLTGAKHIFCFTASGTHPAYPMRTGGFSPWGKAAGASS
jgi:hypothetical protein